ncbi:jupiter microtubule associated homolog 1 [Labrus bergylta]|uniref:Jupiter microtubule associated homolog 1b n=1 Tax=Labrus bergylta TaxID=56723 RepID=A0A3Q3H0H7_9LABR
MREQFCDTLSNQRGPNAGGMGLVGWHRRTSGSGLRYVFQCRVESASCRISAGEEGGGLFLFYYFLIDCLFLPLRRNDTRKMTTTTNFKGMEPGAKSSSRVLRPPGGDSSFSLGTDENSTPQRKNKMTSSIFAEPDDPHAHRRNNPPTGAPTGTLCGEPSAPLRRCQQPLLFPKNPEPELTTIHNSGAALVWSQNKEVENGQEPANDECPDNAEQEDQEQQKETPQPSAPSGGANAAAAAAGGRRNPPGGKSSLILG